MKKIDQANHISNTELVEMSEKMFGNLVKAVVDIKKGIMAVDAEMHADLEAFLLERNSAQQDLWGINLYPEFFGTDDFIEFDSMINLRPTQNNRSRGIDDPDLRSIISTVVKELAKK